MKAQQFAELFGTLVKRVPIKSFFRSSTKENRTLFFGILVFKKGTEKNLFLECKTSILLLTEFVGDIPLTNGSIIIKSDSYKIEVVQKFSKKKLSTLTVKGVEI